MKLASTDAEADAVNDRWEPEVKRAKTEARRLVGELTEERVQARIEREQKAVREAALNRASRLAQWGLGLDQD